MQLRLYQKNFIQNLSKSLKESRKVCGQLATGGGKTVVFSEICHRFTSKSEKSVLILVHRKELLNQTRKTLHKNYGIDTYLIVAGVKYILPSKVYIGMVESVSRRILKIKNIGLVIIDEAHIAVFNKLHEYFPEELILGFTATPLSSNKKEPLKKYYQKLVCGVDIPELIEDGFLCQNITRAPKDAVNRAELSVKNGEFDEVQMGITFSKPRYIHNTVEAYEKHCSGGKTIVFNVNIPHSIEVNKAFIEAGYNSRHLDSTMDDKKRSETLKWFTENEDAILNNVGIATTGFDEPTIVNVIVNKSVMAMTLWLQMCGRGGRTIDEYFIENNQNKYPYPLSLKTYFTIIDMGGNAITHGDWCQSRDWQRIFEEPPKPSDGSGIAPVKSCPNCEAIIAASAKECEWCNFVLPKKDRPVEQEMSEFVVITKDIDPKKIMEDNKEKKEYYAFFKLGNELAKAASETLEEINSENVSFILQKYFELGKQWAKNAPEKKRFNEWHKEQAKIHLFFELKKRFPNWEPQEETYIKYLPKLTPFQLKQNIDVTVFSGGIAYTKIKISELLPFAQANSKKFTYDIL